MTTSAQRNGFGVGGVRGVGSAWGIGFAAAVLLLSASAALGQALERQLRDILGSARLPEVRVGVSVIDVASGEVLAGINDKSSLMPASNLKLFSSGAALLVLGKEYEFRTRLIVDGDKLIVIGSGDPAFAEPKLLEDMKVSVSTFVEKLVESVRKAGVTGITEVVIDDRVFDRDYIHKSWPEDQLNRWYAAEVSGLNFHANLLQIFPKAAERAGSPPTVRTEPAARWIEVVNNAQTVGQGQTGLWASRDTEPSTRFRLFGNVRATPIEPIEVTMHESGLVFGRLLADELTKAGLGSGTIPARLAKGDEKFVETKVVAVVQTPLATVLERCNVDSYNMFADALLKRVGNAVTGQPGSWANGAAVVRMQLSEKVGGDTGELIMADGSGLSRENRTTPLMMASWLAAIARNSAIRDAFVESLAKPGEGTLKSRFDDRKVQGEIRAKSGFIRGVQCLSGYVTHPTTGRRVAFSILLNNVNEKVPGGAAKKFHEDVVDQIDRWLNRNPGR